VANGPKSECGESDSPDPPASFVNAAHFCGRCRNILPMPDRTWDALAGAFRLAQSNRYPAVALKILLMTTLTMLGAVVLAMAVYMLVSRLLLK